jgi:(R)-2-hydroxyacyl-CoA dehydratese activating ATPase
LIERFAFYFAGLDIGAATAKAVVIDHDRNILGRAVARSGLDFSAAAGDVLGEALAQAGIEKDDRSSIFATGYGRANVRGTAGVKTEIACHAKGCFHHFPEAQTIIDIGGQDNKVIKLDDRGRRMNFKMNRKCAAGTGAFLEETAARLGLDLSAMNAMAEKAEEVVELGSYCTVFSATEILEKIRQGKPPDGIVKGIYISMARRVLEMDSLENRVVLTGGVAAHNPIMAEILGEIGGCRVSLAPWAQTTGALGAALFALEEFQEKP